MTVETKQINDEKFKQIIERIERLEEEKKEIGRDINEIYADAKGQGYDVKAMRAVIKLRKMSRIDRDEQEFLIDEYKRILGI